MDLFELEVSLDICPRLGLLDYMGTPFYIFEEIPILFLYLVKSFNLLIVEQNLYDLLLKNLESFKEINLTLVNSSGFEG